MLGKKCVILVVEDEQNVVAAIKEILELRGFVVNFTNRIRLAKMRIERGKIDLVICDNNLAGDDEKGLDLHRWLTANQKPLKYVFIGSPPLTDEDKQHLGSKQASKIKYLPKPLRLTELVSVVDELLSA